MIPKFIVALLRNEAPTVHGDGEQSRDFTYIDNVVDANLLAAAAPDVAGQTFNVACGERISLNDLLGELRTIIGTEVEATYVEARPGDVKHSLADIGRAEEMLGYRPAVSFSEGLRRSVAYLRERAEIDGPMAANRRR